MSPTFLERIACPSCGSPINLDSHTTGKQVHCSSCGNTFLLRGHVCPYCSTYHKEEAAFCRQCGAGLTRRCRKCDTVNWIGDEFCVKCGAAMDIFEVISQRHTVDTKVRLYQQIESARSLKETEETAAAARHGRFMEQERQRQLELQRKLEARRQQERKMMQTALIVGIVIIILILAMILLT